MSHPFSIPVAMPSSLSSSALSGPDLAALSTAKVLVAGDVMLDRYWHGLASRISPEAPVPVVHIQDSTHLPGGAANVAVNIAALGASVNLLGIVGQDEAGQLLTASLRAPGLQTQLLTHADWQTIVKLRVLSHHQQLIRVDFEKDHGDLQHLLSGQSDLITRLTASYTQLLSQAAVVILSDYGKGTLSESRAWIATARKQGIPVLVDPKSHDFKQYHGAYMLTPNQKEFEQVVGTCHDDRALVEKGMNLIEACALNALLVTRGAKGMLLLEKNTAPLFLPAEAHDVFDVTGAGDTVIAVLATAMAAGFGLVDAARFANIAAGIVVGKLGTASVNIAELQQALFSKTVAKTASEATFDPVTESELLALCAMSRTRSERIVMTNGCFDILHAGHMSYLNQAKRLGDRLIIAVNDDASVRRLKGSSRPINSLAERMQVLSAIRAVDWVVPFSEDTPERLIKAIQPDILVKGGDYTVAQIAGADSVLARGGRVEILAFKPGCSTSGMIERMLS